MSVDTNIGSDKIPWRTLLRKGWSSDRIDQVRQSVDTPTDRRTPGQRRRIAEARDVGGNRRRHERNRSIAAKGTRIRTKKGMQTVR